MRADLFFSLCLSVFVGEYFHRGRYVSCMHPSAFWITDRWQGHQAGLIAFAVYIYVCVGEWGCVCDQVTSLVNFTDEQRSSHFLLSPNLQRRRNWGRQSHTAQHTSATHFPSHLQEAISQTNTWHVALIHAHTWIHTHVHTHNGRFPHTQTHSSLFPDKGSPLQLCHDSTKDSIMRESGFRLVIGWKASALFNLLAFLNLPFVFCIMSFLSRCAALAVRKVFDFQFHFYLAASFSIMLELLRRGGLGEHHADQRWHMSEKILWVEEMH